jgi:hypothetical protein
LSISSLANAAAARRTDFLPSGRAPRNLSEIARAAATATPASPQQDQAALEQPANAVNTALNVLFGYIPTEIVTPYVAVVAALKTPNNLPHSQWIAFWVFLGITPIVVWLVYAAKVMNEGKPIPIPFEVWPLWEMIAATIAYSAWAFALPNTPFADYVWYSSALAGIAVVTGSTVLGLLAPFFQHQLTAPA